MASQIKDSLLRDAFEAICGWQSPETLATTESVALSLSSLGGIACDGMAASVATFGVQSTELSAPGPPRTSVM